MNLNKTLDAKAGFRQAGEGGGQGRSTVRLPETGGLRSRQ